MGQNRKVRQGRDKNKLELDPFDEKIKAPPEKAEPKSPLFPNYDFKAEVQKDAENEERLFWVELIIIFGILVFAMLRGLGLAQF